MSWQFLNSGYASGASNMALDVALATNLLEGEGPNTLRVYGWAPPAISLGWNQSRDALAIDRIKRSGIDVVRRPTGGRAILHSQELTYAVIMASEAKNVLEVYNRISQALVLGIRSLGVDAQLERSQTHFPSEYRKRSSLACFTSSARHEIVVAGRKLVGSAQRRYARKDGSEVVLQHGSILMGPDHRRIGEFLSESDAGLRSDLERALAAHTTDLEEQLGMNVRFEDVALAVRQGFESSWNITFSGHAGPVELLPRPAGVDERVHV